MVADRNNHRIRELRRDGTGAWTVRTLAGSGQPGRADGTGSEASFRLPGGVSRWHPTGDVLVADTDNSLIRRIDAARCRQHAGPAAPKAAPTARLAKPVSRQPQNLIVDPAGAASSWPTRATTCCA